MSPRAFPQFTITTFQVSLFFFTYSIPSIENILSFYPNIIMVINILTLNKTTLCIGDFKIMLATHYYLNFIMGW